tara:strand:+ start:167 stop:544 length:378 start_codon:yes stop_codon:yes gene_type:complete
MWDPKTLKRINDEAAEEQLARGAETLLITSIVDIIGIAVGLLNVPNLGDAEIERGMDGIHERIDTLSMEAFDGAGDWNYSPYSSTLSAQEFIERLASLLDEYPKGFRLAVTELDPFYVHVGIWSA